MSIMRVGGLASGMDIESIIANLMAAKRLPLEKLEKEKQLLEWQREDYRALNSQLFNFRNQVFDMKLEAKFNVKNATSSLEEVLKTTAGANAVCGIHTITVNQIAKGVNKGSTTELSAAKNAGGENLSLYEQFSELAQRGFAQTDVVTVTINETQIEIDLGKDTVFTVAAQINNADLGITASYDANYNRFFLTTQTTGANAEITVADDMANLFSNGEADSILGFDIDAGVTYCGENALIDIGDVLGLQSATNTMTVNGLNLNLQKTGTTTITVTADIDGIVDSITEFIESYNKVMDNLYAKIQERCEYNYPPLTKAQREEMSEKEIEMWEAKARKGLLRSDPSLNNVVNNIRTAMSRIIVKDGDHNSLSAIGISTLMWDDKGKLYIDETQLRKALSEDSEGVKELFTAVSETDMSQKGIANHLYEVINNGINYLSAKAGKDTSFSTVDQSFIGERLKNLESGIKRWERELLKAEDRYWRQYTYMEKMLSQMNAQSAWLTQQFQ